MSELVAVERMDALKPLMQRFAHDNGFDNAGFACAEVATPASRHGRFVGILDLPAAWSRRYDSLSKMSSSSSDPVIRHVSKLSIPTTWDCEGRVAFTKPSIAKSARALLGVAGEHGLRAGLTVPLCGRQVAWAYVVLTCRDTSDSRQLLPSLADAALFAQGFMATVRRLTASRLDAPLSAVHREILRWCAIGKTSWEISLILGLSEATINFHLKNIARKLGVHGRTACVGHALANDLIAL